MRVHLFTTGLAFLLVAGCTNAPAEVASSQRAPAPTSSTTTPPPLNTSATSSSSASSEEIVVYVTAPMGVGAKNGNEHDVIGEIPDPTMFSTHENATRLRVTATWTPSIPTADVLYVDLRDASYGKSTVSVSASGSSPLTMTATGIFPAGNYYVSAWPDGGHATNGENVTFRVRLDNATSAAKT